MATTEMAGSRTRARRTAGSGETGDELQVQEKQEARDGAEHTHPGRYYVPPADIFETDEALIVVLDLPGVTRDQIDVRLEGDVLAVDARIDLGKYRELNPVYTEYNIGNFTRRFVLGESVAREDVSARLAEGVLTLELPKVREARPRRIAVD